jgi:uncharacterized protein (DUF2141 family)
MKILCFMLASALCQASIVQINLKKKNSKLGEIGLVVFNSKKGFPKSAVHAYYKSFIKVTDFPLELELPEGEYAISVFHDQNGNRQLDQNFINIPKEPFGFSNDALGMMGPPSFDEAMFQVKQKKKEIVINLKEF